MAADLTNKYFVRRTATGTWEDVTTKFQGVHILTVDGMNELGETVNVFNQQWVDSQAEDFLVAKTDSQGNPVVIRKNVDVSVTFACGERYGASDTQTVHDAFIDYMCNKGDLYIKSAYTGKEVHVICLDGYKPTTQKLHRGSNSYILGTIKLHTLDKPTVTV